MTQTRRHKQQRCGAVLVLAAISLALIITFAALTVDVGYMYVVRSELQATADAAALAAAGTLRTSATPNEAEQVAQTAAADYGEVHDAAGTPVEIAASDVTIGSYWFDHDTGKFIFDPTDDRYPSAVNVITRRPDMNLWFAGFFGENTKTIVAEATAILQPRDIAVVIDLSGSMKYDSDLRFYTTTQINTRDIWASLDGPEPSRPYVPGPRTRLSTAMTPARRSA